MKKVFLGASKHIKCDHDKCTQGQPHFLWKIVNMYT